jgi:hypothetical protein
VLQEEGIEAVEDWEENDDGDGIEVLHTFGVVLATRGRGWPPD